MEERVVANDYTIRFQNRFYQLLKPIYPVANAAAGWSSRRVWMQPGDPLQGPLPENTRR